MFRSRVGALALTATLAQAQTTGQADDGHPWMFMLSGVTDEQSYDNLLATFDLALSESSWLSLAAGSSRAPSSETDVEARLLGAGIEHDFGPMGLGLSYEDWGDPGNLESLSWRGELIFSDDDFRVALSYEARAIEISFSGSGAPLPTDRRRFTLDADGIGLSGRYRISSAWQVFGAFMDYDYPRRIGVVPRADRLNLLSTSAVTLAYSFVDYYANLGFERAFGDRLVSVEIGRDRSAIDRDMLSSLQGSMLWPVARRVDLELTLGRSRSESFGSSVYGGLRFMLYGR